MTKKHPYDWGVVDEKKDPNYISGVQGVILSEFLQTGHTAEYKHPKIWCSWILWDQRPSELKMSQQTEC